MRLFEAIIDANYRALSGDAGAGLRPEEYADSLPVVALTCIDPRLNPLIPEVLGIAEEQFIWLRNAGNIITGPLSSTMRSLALACAIKGGKEIAILGHTDCKVRQTTALELTDGFRRLGVERARLPDNLNEFFGLFASESQNVLRAVDIVRQSPLIGPKIPVHGLLVDLQNGRLEWLANGYQAQPAAVATQPGQAIPGRGDLAALPEFQIGEMKFPEMKIGEAASITISPSQPTARPQPAAQPAQPAPVIPQFDPLAMFKVLGDDRKVYGPVSGTDLMQWLAEGRIKLETLTQKLGYHDWKQLATFILSEELRKKFPLPPRLTPPPREQRGKRLRPPWSRK